MAIPLRARAQEPPVDAPPVPATPAAQLEPPADGQAEARPGEQAPSPPNEAAPGADTAPAPEAESQTRSGGEPPGAAPGKEVTVTTESVQGPPSPAIPVQREVPERPPGFSLRPAWELDALESRPVDPASIHFNPGKGLTFRSSDDDFSVVLDLRAQFLYAIEHENVEGGEDTQSMQLRRVRTTFSGNLFGQNNKYKIEIAISPRDTSSGADGVGTSPLLDTYMDFTYLRDLTLRVGQYKVPFSRQRVVSSGDLQLVDRAITNSEFNLDRIIGLDLRSKDLFGLDTLRYYLGIYPGEGRNTFAQSNFGMTYLARLEVLPFGQFDDYVEADFERTGPRLSLGASYAYLDRAPNDRGILGRAPGDVGTTDFNMLEADAMFMLYGLSAMSEFFYRSGDRNPGALVDDDGMPLVDEEGEPIEESATRDGVGWMLQVGYLLPQLPIEVVGRYALVRGSDDPGHNGLTDANELGGGLNYYFMEHSLKLQGDYMRLFGDDFSSGTDQIRLQLQASL